MLCAWRHQIVAMLRVLRRLFVWCAEPMTVYLPICNRARREMDPDSSEDDEGGVPEMPAEADFVDFCELLFVKDMIRLLEREVKALAACYSWEANRFANLPAPVGNRHAAFWALEANAWTIRWNALLNTLSSMQDLPSCPKASILSRAC